MSEPRDPCPAWCAATHGTNDDDPAWHLSQPAAVQPSHSDRRLLVRLYRDPHRSALPTSLLVEIAEASTIHLRPDEARVLARTLETLADMAEAAEAHYSLPPPREPRPVELRGTGPSRTPPPAAAPTTH